jgi:hypothetical protein
MHQANIELSYHIALRCGSAEPPQRLLEILTHTLSVAVHVSKAALCISVSLVGASLERLKILPIAL